MEEIWKDIEGYEGAYSISTLGRIKSEDSIATPCKARPNGHFVKGRIMKTPVDTMGYKIVRLYKNGGNVKAYVHRLVAEAFLPKDESRNYVNHIDSDRLNNNLENLEWVTQKENCAHSISKGRARYHSGEECNNVKLNKEQVIEIRKLLLVGKTQKEIAEMYNVSPSCIFSISNNRTWRNI